MEDFIVGGRESIRENQIKIPQVTLSLNKSIQRQVCMDYNEDKVDEVVLALLCLTIHDGNRAYKSFDWEVTDRLHEKGLIENPRNKNKSVVLTEEGLRQSKDLFRKLFQTKD